MATSINSSVIWTAPVSNEQKSSVAARLLNFLSSQKQNHTLWFFLTLMVHGVLVLPVPAVLIYYFNAPDWVLGVTMVCFFTNLIANMGGAGIKATIAFFLGSVLIHLAMILAFIL